MNEQNVFVSVGGVATEQQEQFVRAVEDRLRAEGLVPHTVGRNTFGADSPLKTITDLLENCAGTVVIALERTYFPTGLEKRGGPKEIALANVKLATPWNQIEAALAYSRGHPLMVVVEVGVKSEGLLERGYDWYVQSVEPTPAALSTPEFNGVLSSWKQKLSANAMKPKKPMNPAELTVSELFGNMKPSQIWAVLGVVCVLLGAAFGLGKFVSNTSSNLQPSPTHKGAASSP